MRTSFLAIPSRVCLGLLTLSLCVTLVGCDSNDSTGDNEPSQTLAELVTGTDVLSTLDQVLGAADLDGPLSDPEATLTVFAPRNAAFGALTVDALQQDTELLTSVLEYHVVEGAIETSDLEDGRTFTTLQGDELTVSVGANNIQINGSILLQGARASNGIVYIVDRVLLENQTVAERLVLTQNTQTLAQAVASAGLTEALNDAEASFTLFAPTESAFEDIDVSALSQDELASVLQYHVIPDTALVARSITDGQTATTLEGRDVTLAVQNDGLFVNDAQISGFDFGVSNGVVHEIDRVLMPSDDGGVSSVDVTVTVDNVGASAWEVTGVDGADGVAQTGAENPALTLTVGTRYRFVNNGGGAHPLGFQNGSDEYLLNQDGDGSLEGDADINYEEDDDGVTFTYTQTLADAIATYRCTVHASMEGDVQTSS